MFLLPLRFAVAELRHERLFAAGVMLAVCSVLTPVLLLLGVKNGMIESLRGKLMNNPQIREIRLKETVHVSPAWIKEMAKDPLVAFAVPSVRQISLYGRVRLSESREWIEADEILPSAAGDPVANMPEMDWKENTLPVPCMISDLLAESLHSAVGTSLVLEQTRSDAGKPQVAEMLLRICAIVPRSYSPTRALYLPINAIEDIENYKDGKAVGLFRWPGIADESISCFHGLVFRPATYKKATLNELQQELKALFPDADVRILEWADVQSLMGAPLDSTGEVVVVQYEKPMFDLEAARKIQKMSPQLIGSMIPFLIPITARISHSSEPMRSVTIRTRSSQWFPPSELNELFKPPELGTGIEKTTRIEVASSGGIKSLFETVLAHPLELVIDVPPRLAGVIGAGLTQTLAYNQVTGDIRTQRRNYSGFRIYARSIDEVMLLRQKVEHAGYQVRSEEDQIIEVRKLDSGLSKLFLLVAGMAAVGGLGALSASLYLSIERAKRQLCVMQVLGASKTLIGLSIILQALILSVAGSVIAFGFYHLGAQLLQHLFGDAIDKGEVFCKLHASNVILILMITSCIGAGVGLLTSFRLRGLDAAAVARSE